MFNLDPGKLLVIAVVAIILLGPDKLPQFARQVGGAWRSFNEFRHRMESEVRNTMPDLPPTSEIARLARSPSALLNHLSNMSSDDEGGEEPDGSFQPPLPPEGESAVATNGSTPHENSAGPSDPSDRSEPSDPAAAMTTTAPAGTSTTPASTPAAKPATPAPAGPEPAPEAIVPGDPTLN